MNSDKPALRLALRIVLPILMLLASYPLSVGPVQWWYSHRYRAHTEWRMLPVYKPMARFYDAAPNSVRRCLDWYLECFTGPIPYRTHGGII